MHKVILNQQTFISENLSETACEQPVTAAFESDHTLEKPIITAHYPSTGTVTNKGPIKRKELSDDKLL